ncbi:unnamed protein product [Phytomonas sp. EM1]|nr:unnamed protein product [Phytomonas sp. EM1]|eukprot:CCW63111.1 unnamed protein product [Phytomonas sp. isolate EM1]
MGATSPRMPSTVGCITPSPRTPERTLGTTTTMPPLLASGRTTGDGKGPAPGPARAPPPLPPPPPPPPLRGKGSNPTAPHFFPAPPPLSL